MTQSQSLKIDLSQSLQEKRQRLGDVLRDARMKAGFSVDAVAHETKISKHFILSLESGTLESLPGQVFGRGFIKNIARYLKSDANELLTLYDDCWKNSKSPENTTVERHEANFSSAASMISETSTHNATRELAQKHLTTSDIPDIKQLPSVDPVSSGLRLRVPAWLMRRLISQNTLLIILASIAGLMVVGVFSRWLASRPTVAVKPAVVQEAGLTQRQAVPKDSAELASDANSELAHDEVMVPSGVVEKVVDSTTGSVVANKTATSPQSVAPITKDGETTKNAVATTSASVPDESPLSVAGTPVAFDQVIELKVHTPVAIKLMVDGKNLERRTYPVGSSQITFHDKVEMMIQDASALEITFNGKSLGSLGGKGRKRRVYFQAKPTEGDFPY